MSAFADSTRGQIMIGVVVAVIGTIFGALLTWVTVKNAPPVADLIPATLEAEALQPINFSAAGSSDPESSTLQYEWSLNALPFGENPAANCTLSDDPAIINCRFIMPGTHAVTVSVQDEDGLTASKSTSVTVTLENGYLSLVINAPGGPEGQKAAERAFLYAVDWSAVQALVGRPIVLFDPDRKTAVYASTVERDIAAAKEALASPDVNFANLKIGNFGLRPNVQDLIATQAADAGLGIVFFGLPAGEVVTGIGEGGFTLFSSPADFQTIRDNICPGC